MPHAQGIIFADDQGVYYLDETLATPREVVAVDGADGRVSAVLPEGDSLLYAVVSEAATSQVFTVSLDGGQPELLLERPTTTLRLKSHGGLLYLSEVIDRNTFGGVSTYDPATRVLTDLGSVGELFTLWENHAFVYGQSTLIQWHLPGFVDGVQLVDLEQDIDQISVADGGVYYFTSFSDSSDIDEANASHWWVPVGGGESVLVTQFETMTGLNGHGTRRANPVQLRAGRPAGVCAHAQPRW